MKKLIVTLIAMTLLILGSTGIGLATDSVTVTLVVTADNIYYVNVYRPSTGPESIPLGSNYNNWQDTDTYSITLDWLETNYISFYVTNVGNNSPTNPAGFLAQITLDSLGEYFAETGTNQILSGDEDYWRIGIDMFNGSIPTTYADNAGNGNPFWWNAHGGPITGIASDAEWIWTDNNFVQGGDDAAYVSVALTPIGEHGTIAGTVGVSSPQDPIADALVEAMQGAEVIGSDNTELDGSYSIPNLPVGTYNVRASKEGYETKTENGKEVIADQTTTIDFQLSPSPSDTLFFDDFADGNDDGWEKLAGSWSVQNQEYTTSLSGDHVWSVSAAGEDTWTDYIFEVDLKGVAGVDKCVAFRFTDMDNHYGVNIRSDFAGQDQVLLTKNLNGTPSELQVVDYPSQNNTWYHLKIVIIEDNIKVSVDDNLLIDYTDTGTTLTHGRIALVGWTGEVGIDEVHYDNVLVAWPPGVEGIHVLSPNGGEDWMVGSEHDITWTSFNFTGNVKIEYSNNGGTDWTPIISSTEDDGTHPWTIPDDPSTNCLVKVSDAADGDPYDVSNASFTISPQPTLTVTSPNGGENWVVGSEHNITWTSMYFTGNVKIEYSTNGGTDWTTIVSSTANDGTHPWTIPDEPSTNCLVRISDAADGDPYDVSDAPFTISPSTGTIAGLVKDSYTEERIGDVLVETMQGENIIAHDNSESDGSYSIPNLPPGTYNVRASKDGYETKTENGKEVIADQTTTVDFQFNPSPSGTLFFDDFADGNDDDWNRLIGDWAVEDQEYVTSLSGVQVWSVTAAGDGSWTDYIFEVDVKGIAGTNKCIAFRFASFQNHYGVNIRSDWAGADEVLLTKTLNGTPSELQIVDYPSQNNTWYHLKVVVAGDNIKVSVDDNLLIDYTDTGTSLTQGKIALVGWTGEEEVNEVHYDNVLVAPPPYFIHITDPHVGAGGAKERFEYVINKIDSLTPPPDFVVISGDLLHEGNVSTDWVVFESLVDLFDMPHYVCVGNHDYYWDFQPSADYVADHDYCLDANVHLISMNSGEDADWVEEWKRIYWPGEPEGLYIPYIFDMLPEGSGIFPPQGEWLEDKIDDHPGYNKVLFMHHPVVCTKKEHQFEGEEESNGCITKNRENLMNLCRNEEVKVVLSGHTHSPHEYTVDNDNHPIPLPSSPDGYWSSYDVPDLPMYIITGACGEDLKYRKIEIRGNEIRVWEEDGFNEDKKLAKYHNKWGYFAGVDKELQKLTGVNSVYAPGRLHAYDTHGNHVGINDTGTIDLEMDLAYYEDERALIDSTDTLFWVPGELISLMLDPDESYTYEIETFLECSLTVTGHFIEKNDGGEISTVYSKIAVDSGSIGKLFINNEAIDYTLYMDDDGDGTVDREIEPDTIIVGIGGKDRFAELPRLFTLYQNYPNPFNATTEIKYALPNDCWVSLEVYNILGQKVATLVDGKQKAGYKTVRWDAGSFSSGIYFYRLKAEDFTKTRKMILLR